MAAPVFEKSFTQDIRQKVEARHCGDLMFTGDALADTISVHIYDGQNEYPVSGSVVCNCIRADGATVPVTGSISGNTVQATLTQACCAVQGPLTVVMKVTSGDTTATVLKAIYNVDLGETGTTVDPGTIIPNVAALIATIEAAVGSIPPEYTALLATIAKNYTDLTFPVSAGAYCWYDGMLYRAKMDIPTSESWTAAHWQGAVIGTDLAELKSAVAEIDEPARQGGAFVVANGFDTLPTKTNVLQTPYTSDDIINNAIILSDGTIRNDGTDTNYFVSPLIPVTEGLYGLRVVRGNNNLGGLHPTENNSYGYFAANGTSVVSRNSSRTTISTGTMFTFNVPSNAKYIRFSIYKGSSQSDALAYFNQWIFLPNATADIDDSFFVLNPQKADGTIDKIVRADESELEIVDTQARTDIAVIQTGFGAMEPDVKQAEAFIEANDLECVLSDKINVLRIPYTTVDIIDSACILSDGTIRNNGTDTNYFVSPLIPVTVGMYGLKVAHGSSNLGGIHVTANNAYGFFKADGTTVVARNSAMTSLGSNLYTFNVPENAKYIRFTVYKSTYLDAALEYFNQWIFLPNATADIDDSFFTLQTTRDNGEINKIRRGDNSYLEIVDAHARETLDGMTSYVDTVNLYHGSEYTTDDYLDSSSILSDGTIRTGYSDRNYMVTPKIYVQAGTEYTVKPKVWGSLAQANWMRPYKSTDVAIAQPTITDNSDGTYTFTTPANTAYVRFTCYKNNYDFKTAVENVNSTFMLIKGDSSDVPANFVSGFTPYIAINGKIPPTSLLYPDFTLPQLYGKKIVNFGDSIFGNLRPPQDVSTFIGKYTGATAYNCAFGGCRMGEHTGHWDAFSMYRLAYAVANNDFSLQETALEYQDRTSYAEVPLATLEAVDFSDVDMITIAYGANDFGGSNPLDNENDSMDCGTLAGALRYSIDQLQTTYPGIQIVIFGTTFWDKGTENSDTKTNSLGLTTADYNAKLKAVAAEYHLPFFEHYNIGINAYTIGVYMQSDGTHPNINGVKLLAKQIAKELD